MQRGAVIFVVLALTTASARAQQPSVPFWSVPGTTLRDAKGNITYTEIKDPKTFTMKVLDRGQWLTYRYEPNSTKVTKVEAADTSDDYLYDGGEWNGMTVHARGRAHTIRVAGGLVTADDMPAVTVERDSRGRDTAVKRGAEIVATITYDANGQVQRLTVGAMTLDFAVRSDGVHETLRANGAVLYTTVAQPEGKHNMPGTVSLDPVTERLGLGADWRNSVTVHRSATGSLLSVKDAQAHPIVEMVQLGAMSAAFDTKGQPLFYDLWLKYTASPSNLGNGDAGFDVTTALNGVLPNRLIVPATGDASAYVQFPGDGAISSIWTATATPPYRFRVYHETRKAAAMSRTIHATASSMQTGTDEVFRKGREIIHFMLWQCGSYEYWRCDSSGETGYCGNYYEPQYCDTGGGGGGYTPPPDDNGGGSGGSGTGNQVSGDPELRSKVNAALSSANSKLQNSRCGQDLFKDTKLTGSTTSLADVLAQRGSDPATWLNNALKFVNGSTNGACSSFPAWTYVNDTTVNVCSSFKTYGTSADAVILIHEELHSLGLTEKPQYPDAAMTTDEITQWVMTYCGG